MVLNNCHIGYNRTGIEYDNYDLIISGGKISYNEDYGINYDGESGSMEVKDVTFFKNEKSTIHVNPNSSLNKSLISCNKFLHSQNIPIDCNSKYPTPKITICTVGDGAFSLEGTIDTVAKAKIELFLTNQGANNATAFVDSFYTNADGTFSFSLPFERLGENSLINFVATATYDKRFTSKLSAPKAPDYLEIDLTRKSYYVKITGTGDGSSWEKAMSPQSFAKTLPQVEDDVTFYVAEGVYKPIYNHWGETPFTPNQATYLVQSNVTINGGYSKDAKTGAVADPDQYKTIFTGDLLSNGVERNEEGISNVSTIFALFQSNEDLYFDSREYVLKTKGNVVDNGKKKYFNLNGISLTYGGGYGILNGNPSINVSINNCFFNNKIYSLPTAHNTIFKLSHCEITGDNEGYGSVAISSADTIVATDVRFSNTIGEIVFVASQNDNTFISLNHIECFNATTGYFLCSNASTTQIENSSFERTGSYATLIVDNSKNVSIKNCQIENNESNHGLICTRCGTVDLENCDLTENKTNTGVLVLSLSDPKQATLKNCNFKSNESLYVCLIQSESKTPALISDCTFDNNITGRVINMLSEEELVIEKSKITNNKIEGGGIISQSKDLRITKTQIEGNKVKGNDDEINTHSIYAHNIYVDNSTFKNNECDSIFFNVDSTAKFVDNTIENNSAKNWYTDFPKN